MFKDRPEIGERFAEGIVAWLTTVNPAGQPQPAPVWYALEDDHIVIYSRDETPRLRNIRANPRVALHLNSDADGSALAIVHGEAEIIGRELPPSRHPGYAAKYEPHLERWNFTWESYDEGYPVLMYIRPTRIRG